MNCAIPFITYSIFDLESSFVNGGVGGRFRGIAFVYRGTDVLGFVLLGGGGGGILAAAPSAATAASATAASVLLHGILPNGKRRRGGRRGNERRGRRRRLDCGGRGGRLNRISRMVLERSQVLRRLRLL